MKVLILAGGGGTRLWPLSRDKWPKQFLNLSNEGIDSSLLIETIRRCMNEAIRPEDIYIITGASLVEQVQHCLKLANLNAILPNIITEPMRRNTAPAIALAAKFVEEACLSADEVIAVLPADHVFGDAEAFQQQLLEAKALAEQGNIVTLGITPSHPDTGYGYIQIADMQGNWAPVERFVEKPDYQTACEYVKSGLFFWNAGIFLMRIETLNQALAEYAPQISTLAQAGYANAFVNFDQMPDISIDYAVMEQAKNIVVMPLRSSWSDLGSWDNVYDNLQKDAQGNVVRGQNYQTVNTQNCLIWNESGRHIATVGLDDYLIVDTPDALLIMQKGQSQLVKEVVQGVAKGNVPVSKEPMEKQAIWGRMTQLSSPSFEDENAPKAYQVQIHPEQVVEVSSTADIHWCVQAGDGNAMNVDGLKRLETSSSWQQTPQMDSVLQVGKSGLVLLSVGGTPMLRELTAMEASQRQPQVV